MISVKNKGIILLSFFTFVGVLFYFFHLLQSFFAGYVIVSFFILTILDFEFSFLTFLFFTQFFIGDFHRPYMWLSDVMMVEMILIWFFQLFKKGSQIKFPLWYLVLPPSLVLILAFPLSFKEIILDLKVYGFLNFISLVAFSKTVCREFWLKEIFWCCLSPIIFLMVFNELKEKKRLAVISGVVLAAALITASIYGILHTYKILPFEGKFLSINFSDYQNGCYVGMLTSFGWSVTFFAEYFTLTFPLIVFLSYSFEKKVFRFIFFAGGVCAIIANFLTYRRAAFVILIFEILASVFFLLQSHDGKSRKFIRKGLVVLCVMVVISLLILSVVATKKSLIGRQFKRISWAEFRKSPRYKITEVALKMFTYEPVLGLGSGGYSLRLFEFNGEYSRVLDLRRGSPHSTYLKMLSERGMIGLITFLSLISGFLYFGLKCLKILKGREKYFLMAIMTGLGGILIYGLVMDFFWVPAIRILFWIYLAFIAIMAKAILPRVSFTKKKALIVGLIFVALFGYRLWRVKTEPISDHYEAGFYRWEIPRKGRDRRPYRFTSAKALKVLTVKANEIRFRVCSNKPNISKNPQILDVYLNGEHVKKVVLKGKRWKEVVIPSKEWKGKKVFMDLRIGGTWIPYEYGWGKSKKELGVIISKIIQE